MTDGILSVVMSRMKGKTDNKEACVMMGTTRAVRSLCLGVGVLLLIAIINVGLTHAKDTEDKIIFVSTSGRDNVLSPTDGLQGEPATAFEPVV